MDHSYKADRPATGRPPCTNQQLSTTYVDDKLILYELELQKYKVQMELQMAKALAYAEMVANEERKERTIKMTAEIVQKGEVSTMISTEIVLEDGRKLTVSMDKQKAAKINPDIHEIFYDVPCMLSKISTPRSIKQLQECSCAMCKTACATILKWRMLR